MSVKGVSGVTHFAGLMFSSLLKRQELKEIERYGTSLEAFDGRDALADLSEELVDAFQYVIQASMEREIFVEKVESLLDELASISKDPHVLTVFIPTMRNLCDKLYPRQNSSLHL